MHEYVLFEDKGGRPVARTVRGRDGSVRVADGVVLFDLGQAVVRFGMTRGKLLELWEESYADIPWASSPVVKEEASGDAVSESEGVSPAAGEKNGRGGVVSSGGGWEAPRDGRPWEALRRVHGGHLSDDEWACFLELCRRRRLDPWSRQVIPLREVDGRDGTVRLSAITTAAAVRVIAQRSEDYRGQTQPLFCGRDGGWKEVWAGEEPPFACKIGVHRLGHVEPLTHVARFSEHVRAFPTADGKGVELEEFWAKMPTHMLAKCCEVAALRKAFAEDLADVYAFEEMGIGEARRGLPAGARGGEGMGGVDPVEIPTGRPARRVEPLHGYDDDSIPGDDVQFDRALERAGVADAEVRARLIRRFHGEMQMLFDVNPMAAYSRALNKVRDDPVGYGAVPCRGRDFANAN